MRATHILVADDNRQVRKAVCQMISMDKRIHRCSEAENGIEAVQFAEREHPDLIIMDLTMPGMDGLEASRKIKDAEPNITIILVSMHADLISATEMLKAGISAKISKDRAAVELLPAIRSLLHLSGTASIA